VTPIAACRVLWWHFNVVTITVLLLPPLLPYTAAVAVAADPEMVYCTISLAGRCTVSALYGCEVRCRRQRRGRRCQWARVTKYFKPCQGGIAPSPSALDAPQWARVTWSAQVHTLGSRQSVAYLTATRWQFACRRDLSFDRRASIRSDNKTEACADSPKYGPQSVRTIFDTEDPCRDWFV